MININIVKKLKCLILLTPILFVSCLNIDCVGLSKIYKNYECLIIVNEIPDKEAVNNFEIIGESIKTGKDTVYKEDNRWFCTYYKKMEKGDTIIKRKGDLIFSIHKKDTILNFNWECEGKIYK